MTQIHLVRKANELNYKGRGKLIWAACEQCGIERWVRQKEDKPVKKLCMSCAIKKISPYRQQHPGWKGGRIKDKSTGYILVRLYPDDFFYPMVMPNHYVMEHRLVIAKHLKRCLLSWEIVHHINGVKDDNRLENLLLLPHRSQHIPDSIIKRRVRILENRVTLLEAENTALREQFEEISKNLAKVTGEGTIVP